MQLPFWAEAVSKMSTRLRLRPRLEEPNRRPEHVRTQVHVALCDSQFLMSRQFLNRFARRALHRQTLDLDAEDFSAEDSTALSA